MPIVAEDNSYVETTEKAAVIKDKVSSLSSSMSPHRRRVTATGMPKLLPRHVTTNSEGEVSSEAPGNSLSPARGTHLSKNTVMRPTTRGTTSTVIGSNQPRLLKQNLAGQNTEKDLNL